MNQKNGGSKKTGRPKKKINSSERAFADLMVDGGIGCVQSARKVWGWKCEPGSSQARAAVSLKRSKRIRAYIEKKRKQIEKETEAHKIFLDVNELNLDESIYKFAFRRLQEIRDDERLPKQTRFQATLQLEKMYDPSGDVNLILAWLNLLWRGAQGHCPRCHTTFPMWQIKNNRLDEFRAERDERPDIPVTDMFERRMEILTRAEQRKQPHPHQIIALSAPERHIAGLGAARSGKSFLLAQFCLLSFLIPGVEIWLLARTYEDARSEAEYLDNFLTTLFWPNTKHIVRKIEDTKTNELILSSKWGSELRIRSAKSKGSITGRELELAAVAEPGWVPEDIYNHLRARMISRLGSGCPWISSMLVYNLDPSMNPEYVQAERDAARMEMMDEEFASEFEGEMSSSEGSKFPQIRPFNLTSISRERAEVCNFVLGVDQGSKNFAACLLGYDGKRVFTFREYFEKDNQTVKTHMEILRATVPAWLVKIGADPSQWKLTIFDADPLVHPELELMEQEGKEWPTDIVYRPKGKSDIYKNWRSQTYEYVNQLAGSKPEPSLLFDIEYCELLHDQLSRALDKKTDREKDSTPGRDKGWIISDPFRGDHVCDAFVLGLWTVLSAQLSVPDLRAPVEKDPYRDARMAFNYNLMKDEASELRGVKGKVDNEEIFRSAFGRSRGTPSNPFIGPPGYYKDES
jgi:hypothetical protein